MHPPPFWHLSAPTFERWFLPESSQNFAVHDVYLQNCVLDHFYWSLITFFTGTYSCLLVNIVIARELSFYILTIYIPCFMIVLVSWFSFWLDYKAVPARVALGVTTLLAMSTTMGSIQRSLPPVAYTKAVDVWSGVCVFFVFSALLEYALVNYASR